MTGERVRSSYDPAAERYEAAFAAAVHPSAGRSWTWAAGPGRWGGPWPTTGAEDSLGADRRDPYPAEHPTVRLTVEALRG